MLILAIDTSGRQGSVALARGDEGSFALLDSAAIAGGTFSAELVPQISELLAKHDLRKEQIDLFAAASGPGSFTGLRVGLAAVKALGEILEKPIVAVSLLEALASTQAETGNAHAIWNIDPAASVAAVLDAGRGELYVGEYKSGGPLLLLVQEMLLRPEELTQVIEERGGKLAVVASDQKILDGLKAGVADAKALRLRQVTYPGSAGVARLGLVKFLAWQTLTVDQLDANYIRRSDAEMFSLPKILRRQ